MSIGHGGVDRSLKELVEEGLARKIEGNKWTLTPAGLEAGRQLEKKREEKDDGAAD